jgi:hypothetical protein
VYKQIAALSILVASTGLAAVAAADDKPYKEGAVTDVASIRVKDGKFNDYINYLRGPYKAEMDAEKQAGIILDYRFYQVPPRSPHDANLILTVTYPNFAALDRTAEIDAISVKVEGSLKASDQGVADRGSIREILGSELIQELTLK